MNPVTLNERVDIRAVKYLNSRGKEWWKNTLKTDKDRKFEVEYKKVKSFLAGQLDETGKTRVYSFADGKSFGRLFDSSGLQGMQKDIRGAVCDGVVSDLDIVNCHPMILSWICYNNDISCPNLEYYIKHRDKILTDICVFNFDREDAKKLFLKSTNSQWRTKDIGYPFFKEYDAEMKRIQKHLTELPEYNFIKPKVKKGDNELGSFINLCLCYHENEILMKAKEFLESKDIEVCTLAFDGLMHYGPELNELMCELNEFINKEFDFIFKFVYKPHSKKIKVPADFDEESVTCLSYKCMCELFNTSHAKVGNVYICEDIKGEKLIQTEVQLKHRYNHIRVHDKDNQFIDNWLKNIQDTNMRVYIKFDICPTRCPTDVYNLWEPFTYSKMTGDYESDSEGLNKILHLIKVLANHEEKSEKFLLDWMAQIVQYPHIKSVVPVIQSDEGAGKNTLMDILKELLGQTKVWDCTSPEEHIFGRFNDKMQDAFLINLNEANSSKFKGTMGKVRGMITEDRYDLQCKNQGTITLPSFHRFILMTNADYPIPTSEQDRRFGIIKASNELIGKDDFFADMRENVIPNTNSMRTFWDFLISRKVSAKMTKDDLPNTEYHRELKKANAHSIIQWVENITLESKSSETEITMNSYQAWDSYRCFCTDSNIPFNKTTKRSFEVSLSIKNIPGVSKMSDGAKRSRLFDLNILRKHFNIEPEVKVNDIEIDDPE